VIWEIILREAGNGRFCAFGEIEKAVANESRRP